MANFGKWVGCIHCAKAGKFNSFQERCRVLWPALSKGWTTGMELDAQCWTSERSLFWIHSLPPEWRNHTLDSYWCYSYLFITLVGVILWEFNRTYIWNIFEIGLNMERAKRVVGDLYRKTRCLSYVVSCLLMNFPLPEWMFCFFATATPMTWPEESWSRMKLDLAICIYSCVYIYIYIIFWF